MSATGATSEQWQVPREAHLAPDPLTDCLVILTRFFRKPFSAQTLTSGLPLENGKLTLQLFMRAAERAGISARTMARPLGEISAGTFPVVLLLKEGGATVAVGRDDEAGTWRLIDPASGGGEMTITAAELEARYAGYVIYVKPEFRYDERVGMHEVPRPEHWC